MTLKQVFKSYWMILLTTLVLVFWLSFFVTENVHNQFKATYTIEVVSTEIKKEDINTEFFLSALIKEDGSYSYKSVDSEAIFKNHDIKMEDGNNVLKISIDSRYFIGENEKTITSASSDRFVKVIKKVMKFHDPNVVVSEVEIHHFIDPFTVSLISTASVLFISFILALIFKHKLTVPNDEIYDNETMFKYPLTRNYWKKSFKKVSKLKTFDLCLISVLFALQMILKLIHIPSGFESLSIGLTYLVFAFISLCYGPIWGLIIGFSSDIFGFIMKPTIFHPGYTLQAMLTGFVYGICLFKTELRFSRVLLSRIIINILLNGIMGAFLWGSFADLSYEGTIQYMYTISLPKNIIYLIPQALFMYFFLRLSVPLMVRTGLVPKNVIREKESIL